MGGCQHGRRRSPGVIPQVSHLCQRGDPVLVQQVVHELQGFNRHRFRQAALLRVCIE